MRTGNELSASASSDVSAEYSVGIVQIGNDQIEFGKIIDQFFRQFAAASEKACERASADGFDAISEAGPAPIPTQKKGRRS